MRKVRSSAIGLLKILLVVLIAGLVSHLCVPKLGDGGRSKSQMAGVIIKEFGGGLELFRFDIGREPSTEEGLAALIRNPGNLKRWRGPYLPRNEIPRDPWNRPYFYRCPGKHGHYDLFSYGADGLEGGDAENEDIKSWEPKGDAHIVPYHRHMLRVSGPE
jgi:general secretion pathway protein G